MKMIKMFNVMSLALGALGLISSLAACSNEEFQENNYYQGFPGKKVNFTATQEGVIGSRATAIIGSNYLDNDLVPSMRVWGYFAHNAVEGDGVAAGGQYIGDYGCSITIDNHSEGATADWQYNDIDDQAYWPNQPLNFYSIIGAHDATVVTNVTSTVGASKLAHVVADVTIPTDNAAQKDIMFAKSVNQTREFKAEGVDPVDFKFYHALSQIVFSGKCAAKKISAEVQSVTICNADSKGRVGYLTDNGSDVTLGAEIAATRGYGKFAAGLIASATLNGVENKTNAKILTAADGALMMLPQTGATKWATAPGAAVSIETADAQHQTYLKISCKIKNDNVYLVGTSTTYSDVYLPFTIDWEQGKKYTYTLIFGAGVGGYDEDGKPLDTLLPITYTASAPEEWDAVSSIDVPPGFLWAEEKPVDLGLPSGLKWAAGNLGAKAETDAGLYYAWGETEGYAGNAGHNFTWANYKWSVNGSNSNFSKYNSTDATLDLEDDAAHVNLGGSWRMPTTDEFQELFDNTTQTWSDNHNNSGVAGMIFKSKTNGNQIFMPAAGANDAFGIAGIYWSSSFLDGPNSYFMGFTSENFDPVNFDSRCVGLSIRGVCP